MMSKRLPLEAGNASGGSGSVAVGGGRSRLVAVSAALLSTVASVASAQIELIAVDIGVVGQTNGARGVHAVAGAAALVDGLARASGGTSSGLVGSTADVSVRRFPYAGGLWVELRGSLVGNFTCDDAPSEASSVEIDVSTIAVRLDTWCDYSFRTSATYYTGPAAVDFYFSGGGFSGRLDEYGTLGPGVYTISGQAPQEVRDSREPFADLVLVPIEGDVPGVVESARSRPSVGDPRGRSADSGVDRKTGSLPLRFVSGRMFARLGEAIGNWDSVNNDAAATPFAVGPVGYATPTGGGVGHANGVASIIASGDGYLLSVTADVAVDATCISGRGAAAIVSTFNPSRPTDPATPLVLQLDRDLVVSAETQASGMTVTPLSGAIDRGIWRAGTYRVDVASFVEVTAGGHAAEAGSRTLRFTELPPCPADFNGDTTPGDIFDLFDFLVALDGGLDFNGDTSPADIFDLFDFLAVLDAGCP